MVAIGIPTPAIDALQEALKGTSAQVLISGSDGYEESIVRWSETSIKRAGVVIKPHDTQDVATAVKVAKAHKIPFTVCGGGHSTNGASAASEDGMVINLSGISTVKVDTEQMTISAGGGCVWKDVDVEAGKYGLATVGGTVNHTGIGGLTLGGGYGWLSGRYGLVVDNLLEATVVLADGSIVTASEKSHPDLFWALRGAGHSFGVTTEFVYRAYKQDSSIYGGLIGFTPEKLPQVVEFINWFHNNATPDQGIIWGFGGVKPDMKPIIVAALFFNGTQEEGEAFYAPLIKLESVLRTLRQMPYSEMNSSLNPAAEFGGRKTFSSGNFVLPLSVTFMEGLYNDFLTYTDTHHNTGESLMLFEVWPTAKILERPNDATAFSNRGKFYNVITVLKCHDPALDTRLRQAGKTFTEKISNQAGVGKGRRDDKEVGVGHYGNYLESGEKLGAERVYGANTARLQSVKLRYDPGNLFRKVVNLLPN